MPGFLNVIHIKITLDIGLQDNISRVPTDLFDLKKLGSLSKEFIYRIEIDFYDYLQLFREKEVEDTLRTWD